MKAVINARYGSPDVLEIRQVPRPEPKSGEVLIKVHATTVSRTDCGMLRAHPFFVRFMTGFLRPKRPAALRRRTSLNCAIREAADQARIPQTERPWGTPLRLTSVVRRLVTPMSDTWSRIMRARELVTHFATRTASRERVRFSMKQSPPTPTHRSPMRISLWCISGGGCSRGPTTSRQPWLRW